MSEFAFELALCAALETEERRETGYGAGVVARQLGASVADPGGRILDVVCVEPGPAFDDRVALTSETIPDAAIDADVGTGRARYWKDAVADLDVHPEHARRVVDRAVEIGFFDRELRGGREYVRQVARYPNWFGRLRGIENKPDLGTPGDLETQLRTDVSLALVDEAILATESYVTRTHLHRIPDAVGVWRVHRDGGRVTDIEVVRDPTPLATDEPGVEPLAFRPGRTDVAIVSPAAKARVRRRLAERAYGKGWRTYEFPACAACEPGRTGGISDDGDGAVVNGVTLPHCTWKGRIVDANAECGPSCPGHEPTSEPAEVDLDAEREQRTPWIADPTGRRRHQSGLDRFE